MTERGGLISNHFALAEVLEFKPIAKMYQHIWTEKMACPKLEYPKEGTMLYLLL